MTGPTNAPGTGASALAAVAALVAIVAILAGVILLVSSDQALEKLGIFAAAIGLIIPSLAGLLRSDQTKTQTDGALAAVTAQNEAFRAELPTHVQTAILAALDEKNNATPPADAA